MSNAKKIILTLSILFIAIVVSLTACKKDEDDDDPDTKTTDEMLYEMAIVPSGFTWYKNSSQQLESSNFTGHQEDFLRTRYNTKAATMLDGDGKVMENITFPEGSLIVKELYSDNSTLSTYAILYKSPSHEDADADGWVWGYLTAEGTVRSAASNKGGSCRSCHGQSGSIDYTLMNKAYP